MNENKDLFVRRINEALIECGAGRYDQLRDDPMVYIDDEGGETVVVDGHLISVDCDSLAMMLIAIGGALS